MLSGSRDDCLGNLQIGEIATTWGVVGVTDGTEVEVARRSERSGGARVILPDGELLWVEGRQLKAKILGLIPGEIPDEGWDALLEDIRARRKAWRKTCAKKGNEVVVLDGDIPGKVFWAKGGRIGVDTTGGRKWLNVWDVQRKIRGKWQKCRKPPARRTRDYNPLSNMPSPFCDVRSVRKFRGEWQALNGDDEVVILLPEDSALALQEMMNL